MFIILKGPSTFSLVIKLIFCSLIKTILLLGRGDAPKECTQNLYSIKSSIFFYHNWNNTDLSTVISGEIPNASIFKANSVSFILLLELIDALLRIG